MTKAKLRTNKKEEEVKVMEVAKDVVEVAKKAEVKAVKEVETIDVIDKAMEKAKEIAEVEVTTVAPKAEPLVRICTNQDVRTYIGDQWYNLKAGKQVSVPLTVKEKLRKAGYLTAI